MTSRDVSALARAVFEGGRESLRKPGLHYWRIENLVPVPVPPRSPVQLYEGDTYIVLTVSDDSLTMKLFFWLGHLSVPEDHTAAQLVASELDHSFGGGNVIRREVQYHESTAFFAAICSFCALPGGVRDGAW